MTKVFSNRMFGMGALTCAAGLWLGCPGTDAQELKPLAELKQRAKPEAPPEGREGGAVDATHEGHPPELEGVPYPSAYMSYSTGTPGWLAPGDKRSSSADVSFGSGHGGAVTRWTYNTDSTGGVGDVLGIGQSYGGSTGKLSVTPGLPVTRPDNYPKVKP